MTIRRPSEGTKIFSSIFYYMDEITQENQRQKECEITVVLRFSTCNKDIQVQKQEQKIMPMYKQKQLQLNY